MTLASCKIMIDGYKGSEALLTILVARIYPYLDSFGK